MPRGRTNQRENYSPGRKEHVYRSVPKRGMCMNVSFIALDYRLLVGKREDFYKASERRKSR